jgi:hypothetical protein
MFADSVAEAGLEGFGYRVRLATLVNFHRLARGVEDDEAFRAPGNVLLELLADGGLDVGVEIIRDFP